MREFGEFQVVAEQHLRRTPTSDVALANARQYQIRSIPLGVASVERIARSVLNWSYRGEPLDEPMIAARRYLALTGRQVQDAFERYSHVKHQVQVVQGPALDVLRQAASKSAGSMRDAVKWPKIAARMGRATKATA